MILRPHKACAASLQAGFLLLAWTIAVSAQEPPSPRAAPDPGAVAQEQRDIAGRWLGATDAAIQSAGKAGGTLTNIATGKFEGLSRSISIADAASTLGAASALDVRGTVSGAAAIAVGGKVTAGGAALFGEIGAVTGGAVGSFFPVIGNIAGSIVGGAVGTAAGGFIAAFGYDKYLKDYVTSGTTGIMSVFDRAPLNDAMEAKRAFLWATMAPEERAQLQAFKPEEVALLDFGALPYVPVLKQPVPGVPAAPSQQEATLGDGVPASFELNQNSQVNYPLACTVTGERVSCFGRHAQGPGMTLTITLTGTRAGNVLEMDNFTVFEATTGCTSRAEYRGHDTIALEKGGRATIHGSLTARQTLRDSSCKGPLTWGGPYQATGSWRVK
jgi:hypothetical protein